MAYILIYKTDAKITCLVYHKILLPNSF